MLGRRFVWLSAPRGRLLNWNGNARLVSDSSLDGIRADADDRRVGVFADADED